MKLSGKKYWLAASLLIIFFVLILIKTGRTEVETIEVGKGKIQQTVYDTGYVESSSNYDLYTVQGGKVKELKVKIGQKINEGQELLVIENINLSLETGKIKLQLAQARAAASTAELAVSRNQLDLDNASENFSRMKKLLAAGAISKSEFDQAQLTMEKYAKILQEQKETLHNSYEQINIYEELIAELTRQEEDLIIKSPIAGTVMYLPVKTEQVLSQGTLAASIAIPDRLEIKANILSDDLGQVKVGQKAYITAPVMGDKIIEGKIITIYPQAEESQSALGVIQRRVPVIIAINDTANLKPGYETNVSIQTIKKENILIIPREAIITTESKKKQVILINNGRVNYRNITTGIADSKNVEVLSGLKPGDHIVRDSSVKLENGTRVKEIN